MSGKHLIAAACAVAFGLSTTGNALAADNAYTAAASVTMLEAGWAADAMSIQLNAPLTNPSNCPVTNAGYATLNTDPGRDLYHTLLLSALLNGKRVQMLIHGSACAFGKPRVISVVIRP